MDTEWTIKKAVDWGREYLDNAGIDNAGYDSYELFSNVYPVTRTELLVHGDRKVAASYMDRYIEDIHKRAEHIPLQHITGKAYFYGNEFVVNENVLIPRQDTEVLIEELLKVTDSESRVIDMCTGSGCILLTLASLKHVSEDLNGCVGVDISDKALEVAKMNADRLNVPFARFVESNLFEKLDKEIYNGYDVIVSNPPYIRSDVIPTLSLEVKEHDPMLALDGHEDGLFFYRIITKASSEYLKRGGYLLYEIGYDQGEDVSVLMKQNGFCDVKVVKDLAGLDRVVIGHLPE